MWREHIPSSRQTLITKTSKNKREKIDIAARSVKGPVYVDDLEQMKRIPGGGDEESAAPLLDSEDNSTESSNQVAKLHDLNVEDEEKKEKTPEDPFHRTVKLAFCFLGLQVSYVLWGVAQEQIMTHEYKPGKFTSSTFCVFGNRFLALIVAMSIVFYNKVNKPGMPEAPFVSYIPSSLSNSLSSWAQYEALKYLSFPSQVLSKSCKIIPVMLVGIVVNKKSYPLLDYLEALAITAGVAIFTFSENSSDNNDDKSDSALGILLIGCYLAMDSFTSQWQSRVYKQYQVDQYQMMSGNNFWSLFFTGITLLYTGEGYQSIIFIMADSLALYHQIILSITSAVGQLFIFYTIKEFGPVIFTIFMTTRQIFSLFLSCILFAHPLSAMSWCGAILVFVVVFYRIKRKGKD